MNVYKWCNTLTFWIGKKNFGFTKVCPVVKSLACWSRWKRWCCMRFHVFFGFPFPDDFRELHQLIYANAITSKECLSCLSHGCPHSFGSFLSLSKIFIEGYRNECGKKVEWSWSSDFHTLNLLQLIRSCKVRCCDAPPNQPLTKVLPSRPSNPNCKGWFAQTTYELLLFFLDASFSQMFFWGKHHKLFLQWHLAGHGKRLKRHANCWEETLGRARSIEEFCSDLEFTYVCHVCI